jgi:hypothetical protein
MMTADHEGSRAGMARMTRLGRTWRTARQQVAECVVLPMLAVALPWPLAWRTMRWLADRGRFFGAETARAVAMSSTAGFVQDSVRWAARHRLTRMVDYIDPALSFARSDRWMDRHLAVEGDAVPDGPCVFIGFHYGTGFWLLRHLRRHAHRVAFVAAAYTPEQSPGQPLSKDLRRASGRCAGHTCRRQ